MFCPLCKAEYREGVIHCATCHVPLAGSESAARSLSVALWKGSRQKILDQILAVLDAQAVPSHWEEIVNNRAQARVLGLPLRQTKPMFEYEVWVLKSDLERSRLAIVGLKTEREDSLWDEMNWQAIGRRLSRILRSNSSEQDR